MTARRRQLIVNADDLGRTGGINAGIFEAHRRGVVSSATLMVAFAAAEEAVAELPRHPDLGVGLHVTLTGGEPVLPAAAVPSLVDDQGRLPSRPAGLERADPGEVRAEVEAQLGRFVRLTGRLPTHLDSHHHSHRLAVVCEALLAVARREGLPIRSASPQVAERLRREGVPTTDGFIEEFFGSSARLEILLDLLRGLPPGTSELMCHPARPDAELRRDSTYVEERQRELAILTDPRVKQTLDREGIELVHFGWLRLRSA